MHQNVHEVRATETTIPPLRAALLAQILGALVAVGLVALLYPRALDMPLVLALGQGVCAAFTGYKLDSPPWWLPIHLAFMPLVVAASGIGLHPGWYLGGFVLLLLVFWRTDRSRVPLYLSNEKTAQAVAALLPNRPCRFIDLGCGNGALLKTLAQQRPDCDFVGVEHAPLPWLWSLLNLRRLTNCRVRYGDFWSLQLAGHDVAYAFLSPAPMPRLWAKARAEMPPGTLLVSNSFQVPHATPERVIEVSDRRGTRLYCYRPGD